jgi:excisionase family DNA binding protein
MLTVPEAARRAAKNPETIRRWVRSGQLPARKVGTQHVIEEADLAALLKDASRHRPAWLKRTSTGEPMPDARAFLRRQRLSH